MAQSDKNVGFKSTTFDSRSTFYVEEFDGSVIVTFFNFCTCIIRDRNDVDVCFFRGRYYLSCFFCKIPQSGRYRLFLLFHDFFGFRNLSDFHLDKCCWKKSFAYSGWENQLCDTKRGRRSIPLNGVNRRPLNVFQKIEALL